MKFDINEFKKPVVITIPAFDGIEELEIEVRRPNLVTMLSKGDIPNPLLGAAHKAVAGMNFSRVPEKAEDEAMSFVDITNLYCSTCMINPKFEEVEEYLTDDQRLAITTWAMSDIKTLRRFHTQQTNNTNDSTSKAL